MSEVKRFGLGWLRDPPDVRDYWIEIPEEPKGGKTKKTAVKSPLLRYPSDPTRAAGLESVEKSLKKASFAMPPREHFKNVQWCSPIEDQGTLGSCTAQAGVGLLEYFENRSFGKHIDGSRRYLYKVTRNLLGWTGDTGAYCRTTVGAIALFGVPIESYWPYTTSPTFDDEPPAFIYALAQNFQGLVYHRVDHAGLGTETLLFHLRMLMAVGWPLMFGFSCYESIWDQQTEDTGEIPYPAPTERRVGGHAVVAVGYDDEKKIKSSRPGGTETKGAFLIRNSWGINWGCIPPDAPPETTRGYGWLPYEYMKSGLAVDWWSLTKAEWIDSGQFDL